MVTDVRRRRENSYSADLTQEPDLIVEQIFFYNLAVLPSCNRAELELEGLSSRVVYCAVQALPRADHLSLPPCDGARPIARAEHHPVRVVVEVVFDGLEECFGLGLVCVAPRVGSG